MNQAEFFVREQIRRHVQAVQSWRDEVTHSRDVETAFIKATHRPHASSIIRSCAGLYRSSEQSAIHAVETALFARVDDIETGPKAQRMMRYAQGHFPRVYNALRAKLVEINKER